MESTSIVDVLYCKVKNVPVYWIGGDLYLRIVIAEPKHHLQGLCIQKALLHYIHTSEEVSSMYFKVRAEKQEVVRIFNVIICWTHRIYGVSKIVPEFILVKLTETNPPLR